MAEFASPYYPYEKVQTGYNDFLGAEQIPYKILTYLMDMPDRNGYVPVDDNGRPRVRLMKYLWYDGTNPLGEPLPAPEEKLSLLFNGDEPVLNTEEQKKAHPKGYRLYAQRFWGQSQVEAQSTIKCYIGRVIPLDGYRASIGLTFEIMSNVNLETNTKTNSYARCYDMEQCILQALHGVNITGVGAVDFSRAAHADSGSRPIYDEGTNVGRELKMSVLWMGSRMQMPETWN